VADEDDGDELQAWADSDDVLTYTGATVTDDEILRAQDIIELFAGATYAATGNMTQTNLRRLNRAVCYQAAWAQVHPDIYTNVDVSSASHGVGGYVPDHVNAALLAPLAKRHLDRLTWRLRPLRVRRRYNQYDYQNEGSRDSAVADENRLWRPM
jgi:hypothetical protein